MCFFFSLWPSERSSLDIVAVFKVEKCQWISHAHWCRHSIEWKITWGLSDTYPKTHLPSLSPPPSPLLNLSSLAPPSTKGKRTLIEGGRCIVVVVVVVLRSGVCSWASHVHVHCGFWVLWGHKWGIGCHSNHGISLFVSVIMLLLSPPGFKPYIVVSSVNRCSLQVWSKMCRCFCTHSLSLSSLVMLCQPRFCSISRPGSVTMCVNVTEIILLVWFLAWKHDWVCYLL